MPRITILTGRARFCARTARQALASVTLAGLLALTFLIAATDGTERAAAAPVNLNVHVHDNYYHPAGAFIVGSGTSHSVAQAACQKASPDAACDATIHQGDTITWVAPAPQAMNQHTVTECTDNSFTVCGAGVAPPSPIGDSGLRQPPPATAPSGWPYGPIQFNDTGVFYYRCEVHPDVMRGRIVVLAPPQPVVAVGGVTQIEARQSAAHAAGGGTLTGSASAAGAAMGLGLLTIFAAASGLCIRRRWLRRSSRGAGSD